MDFKFKRKRTDTFSKADVLDELEKAAEHFKHIEFGWRDFNKVAGISASSVSIFCIVVACERFLPVS